MNDNEKPSALYDVTGIGNAIVDVLNFSDEAALSKHGLNKGSMMLIDEARSQALYEQMGPSTECSGGSVANTLAGMASLGAKTAFIGKIRNDQLGSIFSHDLHAQGVHFKTPAAESGPATASCLVYVTPDAQRTMATYLGACGQVSEADIDEELIRNSAVLYIEGYLWDTESVKAALRKAMGIARAAGRKIAFTLSDTFCVDRHRDEFLQLAREVNILFANEAELKSLFRTSELEDGLAKLGDTCLLAAVTRGEKGSVVLHGGAMEMVSTKPVARVVDTTGAGDLYAAGFLFGLAGGWKAAECAQLGNRCAGQIITQLGARSMKPLKDLVTPKN